MKVVRNIHDVPSDQDIYVFGAGSGGRIALAALRTSGHRVAAVIDSVKTGAIDGLEILSPEAFGALNLPDAPVLVASQYWAPIFDTLHRNGHRAVFNAYPFVLENAHLLSGARTLPSAPSLPGGEDEPTPTEFWSDFNVAQHRAFATAEESLTHLEWRNSIYIYYDDLMPTTGMDGKVVLDYGCGPGLDLVGFAVNSRPSRLIAADISPVALSEARHRVALHGVDIEWTQIDPENVRLPFEDASIDLIHSSGVLHHTPDPVAIMREFKRILKPGGQAQIMVYNRNSIFVQLYVAYLQMLKEDHFKGFTLEQAFQRLTDGPNCPISECYTPSTFLDMARQAGLKAEFTGNAISVMELDWLAQRNAALLDPRLPRESRQFLYSLTFDSRGCPLHNGVVAGIDACFRLTAS